LSNSKPKREIGLPSV